ncbi:hypothetical protein GCM10020331_075110 [Ectobacillus funiculus]
MELFGFTTANVVQTAKGLLQTAKKVYYIHKNGGKWIMKFFYRYCKPRRHQKKAYKLGVLAGVTTNPSLVAKEGVKFEDRIAEICQAVPRVESVSAEVTPDAITAAEMIAQAEELIKINGGDDKVTIKLPMTLAGLEACRYLADKGVKNERYPYLYSESSIVGSSCRGNVCISILRPFR